jgi:negative regulator of flagellin synthesis FlgM
MKVKDASELRGIEANRPPEPKKKTESTTSSAASDKVSNEVKAQVAAAADASRQQVGNDRAVRLEEIKAAVSRGAFQPDPNRIAQRILDDAELTAKIQALLKR